MALEFRNIDDDIVWDGYVQALPNYSFLTSSARYRYNERVGAKTSRIAIFANEKFIGIIFPSIGSSKLFGKYLECKHSPTLIENRGVYWEEIFKYVKDLARSNNCFMLRFSPLVVENEEIRKFYKKHSLKEAPIHNIDALISQHVDLNKDLETLRREMSKTKRNLLNRSLKDDSVTVEIFKDDSQFEIFKDFHNQTTKLKGYIDKPVDMLIEEFREQISKGMFYILIGYYNGKSIGFWQCTVYGKNIHLYQAGTDTEFREKNINISYVLYWETLKLAKELGYEKLDLFGGVVPEGYEDGKHPWKGISDFKQSLGGQKITYMHSRDYALKRIVYIGYYILSTLRTRAKGYTTKW